MNFFSKIIRLSVLCFIVFNIVFTLPDQVQAQGAPYKNLTIPGTIQAEDYNTGGEGIAYHDLNTNNQGNRYRTDGVDIKQGATLSEFTVGWIQTGEWLNYTVNVQQSGYYVVYATVATDQTDSPNFSLFLDNTKISTISIPSTTSWENLTTIVGSAISLPAGQHVLRIEVNKQWFDLDNLIFEPLTSSQACVTDINNDNITELSDYSILVGNFFSNSPNPPKTDISGDGLVDLTDYSALTLNFFRSCDPDQYPTPPPTVAPTLSPLPSGTGGTLRAAAQAKGKFIGAEISAPAVWSGQDPTYLQVLEREFNLMVPGNELKMKAISSGANSYNFSNADAAVNYGVSKNLSVTAHTLVWYKHVPAWLENSSWSNAQIEQWLETYIKTVVGRYKGKVKSWDVVNEPIYFKPSTGEVREREESFWYQKLGPSYIEKAFRWAHEADPDAKLYINEYSTEWNNPKTDFLFTKVQELKNKGVPIHGVGFQVHTHYNVNATYDQVFSSFKKFTDIGLEVAVTEMDVAIQSPVTQEKLDAQAQVYANVTRACMALSKCSGVTTWGVTDKYSWLGVDKAGLLFDANYNKKPAYFAVLNELKK